MRIGIVAPEFPPDIGGVETYSYECSAELARRGHDVIVFTRPHAAVEEIGRGIIKVIPELTGEYALDRQLPKKFSMDVWHVMNAGYAWLASETPDVVVSVHGNDFINPYFLPTPTNLSRVVGLWRFQSQIRPVHTWLWRHTALRLMGRGLLRARQVIANSEYTKSILIKRWPRCMATTSVGYVGVGEEFLRMRHQRCGSDKAIRFLAVCRLSETRKNVDKVLRALARLKQYPFQYTVVGDGDLRPELESLCRRLELEDRVHFTGFIPKTEMQELLASSDLFVLPSAVLPDSVEGFGIVYLEANACGTPVLAARGAGAVEAVDEGKSGYFVEEPSIPAITEALERFLTGEVAFKSEECQAFASRFTWAKVVDHAMQYYFSESHDEELRSSRPASLLY
jgi:phosphatidylinositol alpha-1,6-mannosyltransferase